MKILPVSFAVLRLVGLWPAAKWSINWKKKMIYNLYKLLVIYLSIVEILSGAIELLINIDDIDAIVNNSFMLISLISNVCKVYSILSHQSNIKKLLNYLNLDLCQAKCSYEKEISSENDEKIRRVVKLYGWMFISSVTTVTITSLLNDIPAKTLPFKGWFPFSLTSSIGFWCAYLQQIISHIYGALISYGVDTFIYGTMIHSTTQLKILQYRLKNASDVIYDGFVNQKTLKIDDSVYLERKVINNCIRHHLLILKFSDLSNDIFSFIIFIQYSLSSLIICISAYALTRLPFMSSEFMFMLSYILCILMQIFFYCWYGNEVILESIKIRMCTYEMNWSNLSVRTQRDLMMIVTRASYPIEFNSAHIFTLSLESYNKILKLSYSIYNLLSQTT